MHYYGYIEIILSAVGFAIFYIWQRRSLKRDMEATQARLKSGPSDGKQAEDNH